MFAKPYFCSMNYVVAIDFGLKRCGIAISDSNKIIASPKETIDSSTLLEYLNKLFVTNPFDTIVLGFPKKLNGEDTHITQNVLALKDVLCKQFSKSKTILFDERFTSKIAYHAIRDAGLKKKQRKEKGLVDKISASILLQDFLNTKDSNHAF